VSGAAELAASILPPLNAVLNAASATLVVLGFRAIRAGDRARHQRRMVAAVAVSAAFSKPRYLSRDQVPQADADEERSTLEGITRAEGKPEQAVAKIVEGRLNAWYKDQVLLEQPYAKDDKQSITDLLGDAKIARFAQVYIGS